MEAQFVIFVFLALATLVGAASVALSRNIFWSAMGLLSCLIGVGGLYVLLSADFVAITQLLVYIGGVLVLIIFAVMLTSQIQDINVSNRSMGLVGRLRCLLRDRDATLLCRNVGALEAHHRASHRRYHGGHWQRPAWHLAAAV
jgi:uncharacterized MnhB-related membrane protein